jgi:hypothetical protein
MKGHYHQKRGNPVTSLSLHTYFFLARQPRYGKARLHSTMGIKVYHGACLCHKVKAAVALDGGNQRYSNSTKKVCSVNGR